MLYLETKNQLQESEKAQKYKVSNFPLITINSKIDQIGLENNTYISLFLSRQDSSLHTDLQMNLAKWKILAVGKTFSLMHLNHLCYTVKFKLCACSYFTLSQFLQQIHLL